MAAPHTLASTGAQHLADTHQLPKGSAGRSAPPLLGHPPQPPPTTSLPQDPLKHNLHARPLLDTPTPCSQLVTMETPQHLPLACRHRKGRREHPCLGVLGPPNPGQPTSHSRPGASPLGDSSACTFSANRDSTVTESTRTGAARPRRCPASREHPGPSPGCPKRPQLASGSRRAPQPLPASQNMRLLHSFSPVSPTAKAQPPAQPPCSPQGLLTGSLCCHQAEIHACQDPGTCSQRRLGGREAGALSTPRRPPPGPQGPHSLASFV